LGSHVARDAVQFWDAAGFVVQGGLRDAAGRTRPSAYPSIPLVRTSRRRARSGIIGPKDHYRRVYLAYVEYRRAHTLLAGVPEVGGHSACCAHPPVRAHAAERRLAIAGRCNTAQIPGDALQHRANVVRRVATPRNVLQRGATGSVAQEYRLPNKRGTVTMARWDKPDSASGARGCRCTRCRCTPRDTRNVPVSQQCVTRDDRRNAVQRWRAGRAGRVHYAARKSPRARQCGGQRAATDNICRPTSAPGRVADHRSATTCLCMRVLHQPRRQRQSR
jgi:hypothetical protein